MDEKEYWTAVEFRVCREINRVPSNRMRYLWCDGFEPERYVLDGPAPAIDGRTWICKGSLQDEWKFTLLLPKPAAARQDIDWESLFPPENSVRWLSLDSEKKQVRIDPAAASPAC